MDSNIFTKDTRVPTFIPFDNTDSVEPKPTKKVTKRKRTAQSENAKPSKRKASNKKQLMEKSNKTSISFFFFFSLFTIELICFFLIYRW
jgi:hypothetical protein